MNKEYILSLFPRGETIYSNSKARYFEMSSDKLDGIIEKILTRYELETGRLEAKVYAYEQIIANSNFKSILEKEKKDEPIQMELQHKD